MHTDARPYSCDICFKVIITLFLMLGPGNGPANGDTLLPIFKIDFFFVF